MGYGTITAHSLMGLEARGTLFVSPGLDVRTFLNMLIYNTHVLFLYWFSY